MVSLPSATANGMHGHTSETSSLVRPIPEVRTRHRHRKPCVGSLPSADGETIDGLTMPHTDIQSLRHSGTRRSGAIVEERPRSGTIVNEEFNCHRQDRIRGKEMNVFWHPVARHVLRSPASTPPALGSLTPPGSESIAATGSGQ